MVFVRNDQDIPADATRVAWGLASLNGPAIRVEDGFTRSVGPGADLISRQSWVVDDAGMYYDATRPSGLEKLLLTTEFDAFLRERAARLRHRMRTARIAKYNVGRACWQRPGTDRRVILVPGQVESDASIRYGSPVLKTNMAMLRAVREGNPEAYLVYKLHPDVVANLRVQGEGESDAAAVCDEVVADQDMDHILGQVDEVHTLTSLTGFEALIRELPVTCYGQPFYSGWRLTQDVYPQPRPTRRLALDELIVATLILYSSYTTETTGHFITVERVMDEMELKRQASGDNLLLGKDSRGYFGRDGNSEARRRESEDSMKLIITGGAGFIGSAVIRHLINSTSHSVLNLDKLTYAGNLESLASVVSSERYAFGRGDICDSILLDRIFEEFQPDAVMHLAAESHVDRSIAGPGDFIQTNIVGTYTLLEAARRFWGRLDSSRKDSFRFHHVSTDEVYGDLEEAGRLFTEEAPYAPSSPYSASKAGSDHLVRAWHRTYGLPVLVTNCSNNYGPYHFPEKLIPHMILNALAGKPLPVYGDGCQVRDWLYVEDHARALVEVVTRGQVGQTYNIGGHNEKRNIEVVEAICSLLEEMGPDKPMGLARYRDLISFVPDRPGHDIRYAINSGKIQRELGWAPLETFDTGLRKTVHWYLSNRSWWQRVLSGDYRLMRIGEAL